jgi:uncharacterized C2H2 Zn-finger protein
MQTVEETLFLNRKTKENSFKFNVRVHLRGSKKNPLVSTKLNLERQTDEIVLNKARCDLIFRAHLFLRNFSNVPLWYPLNLERQTDEIVLNKARCDLIFRAHLFLHNFSNVPDPSCRCGYRAQTTEASTFTLPPI